MPTTIKSFLMFEGAAEEAMNFYVGLFPEGRVISIERYGPDGPGVEGSVVVATFEIAGCTVMCSDSPISHSFTFTPSSSLFVTCVSDSEIEKICASLLDGGEALMPLDNYGFSKKFAWINDRFGVSWQLNLE